MSFISALKVDLSNSYGRQVVTDILFVFLPFIGLAFHQVFKH